MGFGTLSLLFHVSSIVHVHCVLLEQLICVWHFQRSRCASYHQPSILCCTLTQQCTCPHSRDFFFGIYTAAHGSTCQSRPGSYLYEGIDSATYCDYGIDYLKIDQCGGDSYEHHHQDKNISWLKFQAGFRTCLAKTGRPIVQSVESCSTVTGCGEWIANCANLWRTGSDLEATWGSIMKNLDQTAPLYSLAEISGTGTSRAGHWNDPDMLQVRATPSSVGSHGLVHR
jgi:hypothetical protein